MPPIRPAHTFNDFVDEVSRDFAGLAHFNAGGANVESGSVKFILAAIITGSDTPKVTVPVHLYTIHELEPLLAVKLPCRILKRLISLSLFERLEVTLL